MDENATTRWYDAHADVFAGRTQGLDMSHLYRPFLELLPPGGKVLDAGCGAGRDSKVFLERGFDVTLMDASVELAKVAGNFTGRPVQLMRFQEVTWEAEFDGVWACASLLHVPEGELSDVFYRLTRALKPGGVLYASFKQGEGERTDGGSGRHFTDMTENRLFDLVKQVPVLEPLRIWTNNDSRVGQQLPWVNGLFKRG